MPVNHVKEYLISVHTSVVFSHFYVRASNGSHYSNFGNKCPKLGTDTPEDMLFTNLAEATWSSEIGIALLCIKVTHPPKKSYNLVGMYQSSLNKSNAQISVSI